MNFCLILDLKDDSQLIAQYKAHHLKVWPEVINSIKVSGIINMSIYNIANRLVMNIETAEDFSFERKAQLDAENSFIKDWENLMDRYQSRLPFAHKDEKWVIMDKIFNLQDY
jgi:L-rhamnose mutarotase